MSHRDTPRSVEVWMDGDCGLCRGARRWLEAQSPQARLRFHDFREAADGELPVERRLHERSMWVCDVHGGLHQGFEASRLLMATVPRWRWLARLTAHPPLRWLGAVTYRLVARFRPR